MAVHSNIYSREMDTSYEGCVLDYYEHNGAWDSDWYAIVWDRDRQEIREVEYDTTRCGGGGYVEIDATKDVLREVYRYRKKQAAAIIDLRNEADAKIVRKGDTVRIVKGRKVPVGSEATVFWTGARYNPYSRRDEDRIGIEINGERTFISAENAEPIGWESRLVRGRRRKEMIRNATLNMIPTHYRKFFKEESRYFAA